MKIKCLLVDDEPIAQDIIESYINRVEVLELAGKCYSAIDAFNILQTKKIDLVFLDIEMPQLSGLNLLRTLPDPPKTVITSAYPEYALEGYELDVLDYLIKPISFERFMKTVGKVLKNSPGASPASLAQAAPEDHFIFAKEERKLVKIFLKDILYLESLKDYVKIKTLTRQVITRHTITYYEQLLPKEQFIRIHRSFIVPMAKIETITENKIEAGGQSIAIGPSYKHFVWERLNLNQIMK